MRPGPVLYHHALCMARALLLALKWQQQIVGTDGMISLAPGMEQPLAVAAAGFWAEHCDRATMPSWSASLGYQGRLSDDGAAVCVRLW